VGDEGSLVEFARPELVSRVERARRRIWLVSPYITGGIANEIAKAAERSKAQERWLITKLEERSVRSGVLSAKGLLRLRKAKFHVLSLEDLHAKVSVIDGWGLVGSGNLTEKGLGPKDDPAGQKKSNAELGVILAASQVKEAVEHVRDWRRLASEPTAAEIKEFADLPMYPPPKTKLKKPSRSVGVIGTERLKELLEGPADPDRKYWVDPNYHDRTNPRWWERGWVSDRREVGIKKDDLLVIYLSTKNRGPAKCVAVVRALGPAKEDEAFVIRERDFEAAEHWPWVVRIEVVGDVPVADGVSLSVIDPKIAFSLENGPRELTREQFEKLAWALVT
jgi:hypothetical protein